MNSLSYPDNLLWPVSYNKIATNKFSTFTGFEPAILNQAIQFQVSKAGNSPLLIKLTLSDVVIAHPVRWPDRSRLKTWQFQCKGFSHLMPTSNVLNSHFLSGTIILVWNPALRIDLTIICNLGFGFPSWGHEFCYYVLEYSASIKH